MKTLTSKQYRQHDAITFALAMAMFVLIFICAICHTSCTTQHVAYDTAQPAYMQDTAKWNAFLRCSANEGDAGCDSCFYVTYGYHAQDAGYLKYDKE